MKYRALPTDPLTTVRPRCTWWDARDGDVMLKTDEKKKTITARDRGELQLFEIYLRRRAEKPDENVFVAYAEVYGEVVYESPLEPKEST